MDEVFGEGNFCCLISFVTTGGIKQNFLSTRCSYLLWYNRDKEQAKYRQPYFEKNVHDGSVKTYTWVDFETIERRGLTLTEKSTTTIPDGGKLYRPGASLSRWPGLASWALAIRTTCWPTV